MFADKELKTIVDVADRKMDDVLNDGKGSDSDYIRNLQTLITLKSAATQKIQQIEERKNAL